MNKKQIKKDDGRNLYFYTFEDVYEKTKNEPGNNETKAEKGE